MSSNCTIVANPDIAGIGVRVSIYIQALLALLSAAAALYTYAMNHAEVSNLGVNGEEKAAASKQRQLELWRADPAAAEEQLHARYNAALEEERKDVRQTWLPVQVTGAALLVSAIIQAKVYGLDLYHALIVINLSWLNNITALGLALTDLFLKSPVDFFSGTLKGGQKQFVPSYICALHLTATAAFGLWVFSNIDNFDDSSDCNSDIHYWVFGHQVSVTTYGFRRAGLVISGLAICPVVNTTLELLFTAVLGFCFQLPGLLLHIMIVPILALIYLLIFKWFVPLHQREAHIKFLGNLPIHSPARRVFTVAMSYAFMIMIFIIATEELIVINSGLVQAGEDDWSFGQTLAMFVLLPVFMDVWSKLRKAWNIKLAQKTDEATGAATSDGDEKDTKNDHRGATDDKTQEVPTGQYETTAPSAGELCQVPPQDLPATGEDVDTAVLPVLHRLITSTSTTPE